MSILQSPEPGATRRRLPLIPALIATGLGAGFSPWASGTVGTAVGLLAYALIPSSDSALILGGMIIAAFAAGVPAAARIAEVVGDVLTPSAALTKQTFQADSPSHVDPSIVVVDEIVGMWVTLFLLPKTIPVMIIGFILFRLMDIIKPQPARALEALPRGWGIMLDDVMAGVYANLATRAILLLTAWMIAA